MDGLSVEEFLIQIGQEFQSFSSVFRQNGFGSLRCIRVNEDINICLLLGIKRQLQNTLMNLKDVSETCGLSASTKQKSAEKPSMGKILDTNKATIYTLKRQLDNSEAELNTMTLVEKAKDQTRRCTNYHETGHKTDGNKNNQPCAKLPYLSISNCDQVDKHPEYTIEKRRKQREVGQQKQKMKKKMTEEQKMLETYTLTRKHDFINNLRERLRASNSRKYIGGSVLMRDLFALKTHFKGEAPTENGRDSLDVTEALSSIGKKRENLQVNSVKRNLKIDDDDISTNMKAAKLAFPMCQPQPQPQFPYPYLYPIYHQMPFFPNVNSGQISGTFNTQIQGFPTSYLFSNASVKPKPKSDGNIS